MNDFFKLNLALFQTLLLFSCNSSESACFEGTFVSKDDHKKIVTIDDSTFIFSGRLKDGSDVEQFFIDKDGEVNTTPDCTNIQFRIDSTDNNNGQYISAYSGDYRCYGYHLICDKDQLCLTPLKSLSGIEYHFTYPELYIRSGHELDPSHYEPIKIYVDEHTKRDIALYVAFDQSDQDDVRNLKEDSNSIRLDSTGLVRSNIQINPMIYALKKYKAIYISRSQVAQEEIPILQKNEIPVILGKTIQSLKETMTRSEQKSVLEKMNIEDLYLIAYRFNPGRNRVVNRVFGEEIKGQVQTFELRSFKSDYDTE